MLDALRKDGVGIAVVTHDRRSPRRSPTGCCGCPRAGWNEQGEAAERDHQPRRPRPAKSCHQAGAGLVVAAAALAAGGPGHPGACCSPAPWWRWPLSGLGPAALAKRGLGRPAPEHCRIGLANALFGRPGRLGRSAARSRCGWSPIALPGVLTAVQHRPHRLAGLPHPAAARRTARSRTARSPPCGCFRCWPRMAHHRPGPPGPRRVRRAKPRSPRSGFSSARLHLLVGAIRRPPGSPAAMTPRGFDSRLPATYAPSKPSNRPTSSC